MPKRKETPLPTAPPGAWPVHETEADMHQRQSPDQAARRWLAEHPDARTVLWVVSRSKRSVTRWRYVVRNGAVYRAPLPPPEGFWQALSALALMFIGCYAASWAVWLAR